MDPKQRAGQTAVSYIKSGMLVGLGTGSTAKLFIDALGAALAEGKLKDIKGIPTSIRSEQQAQRLGIPLTTFAESPTLDVTVDGADEVGPGLNLIKGLGGALLREKLVAQNSRRLVIVADDTKRVASLGTKCPLPVEVTQFSHQASERYLKGLGCVPTLRLAENGSPYVTDNGNYIYDCKFARIDDPRGLEEKLAHRAGIVETGLFLDIADTVLLAGSDGVETLKR
ncbi:MAG: ribose-5-phosphate isomerase RpiA [Tepidisphaeraceae bacterium]|jgi:ribose 5-phosphate isomerase A